MIATVAMRQPSRWRAFPFEGVALLLAGALTLLSYFVPWFAVTFSGPLASPLMESPANTVMNCDATTSCLTLSAVVLPYVGFSLLALALLTFALAWRHAPRYLVPALATLGAVALVIDLRALLADMAVYAFMAGLQAPGTVMRPAISLAVIVLACALTLTAVMWAWLRATIFSPRLAR